MGKPSAPPPPDYAALARQQGVESRDTAVYNSAINRVDQLGPNGSTTWSIRPGADPQNPKPGDYIQTTALSPQQQQIQDAQFGINKNFLDTAQTGLGRVSDAMASKFDTSGLPNPTVTGQPQVGSVATTPLQMGLSRSGLPELTGGTDASRARVEQALMSRINPELDRQQSSLDTRLLNSGIEKGSAGWDREQQNFGQQRNDALMQVIQAGGAEDSRISDLTRANRGQLFGEEATSGGFANSAAGQQFGQGLQAGNFANSSAMQAIAQALQARGQGLQEQSFLRQLPINEINALRTGAQVQGPQFGSYYTGGSAQSAPIMDAGIAQGNYNMNSYQQQMAGYNALMGGLANMGSAFLMPGG